MFLCQIELLSYLNPGSPKYYVLATYGFDPGLQVQDEEVSIQCWEVWGYIHSLKVKVEGKKKEIYPDGREWLKTRSESCRKVLEVAYPTGVAELAKGGSLFLLRVFVDAEDRDKMLEIADLIEKRGRELDEQGWVGIKTASPS